MHRFVLPKDRVRMKLAEYVLTDTDDASGTMMHSHVGSPRGYELVDPVGVPIDRSKVA